MINDSVGYAGPEIDGIGKEMGPGCVLGAVAVGAGLVESILTLPNVAGWGIWAGGAVSWKQGCT